MTLFQITPEEGIVLGARLRRQGLADQIDIARQHFPKGPRRAEIVHADTDRDA